MSKFFDRESLRDGMDAIFNFGIRGKLYRLLFNLNKDTRISVQTAAGLSEQRETGENIGQGTQEGAILSASNVDYTVNRYFSASRHELSYGNVGLQPLLYQDDISRLSTSVQSAQFGNIRMEWVAETKLLDFNSEKSCCIILGSKVAKKALERDLESQPLTLCGKNMKCVTEEKYLGDVLSTGGLAESVKATILKRKGQVIRSIIEIRTSWRTLGLMYLGV